MSDLNGEEGIGERIVECERVTERERMYIEAQYALQQYDLPKSLEAYKLYASAYPRDAAALNNLAAVYQVMGQLEQAADGYKKAWEEAKWDNIAATTLLPYCFRTAHGVRRTMALKWR